MIIEKTMEVVNMIISYPIEFSKNSLFAKGLEISNKGKCKEKMTKECFPK